MSKETGYRRNLLKVIAAGWVFIFYSLSGVDRLDACQGFDPGLRSGKPLCTLHGLIQIGDKNHNAIGDAVVWFSWKHGPSKSADPYSAWDEVTNIGKHTHSEYQWTRYDRGFFNLYAKDSISSFLEKNRKVLKRLHYNVRANHRFCYNIGPLHSFGIKRITFRFMITKKGYQTTNLGPYTEYVTGGAKRPTKIWYMRYVGFYQTVLNKP